MDLDPGLDVCWEGDYDRLYSRPQTNVRIPHGVISAGLLPCRYMREDFGVSPLLASPGYFGAKYGARTVGSYFVIGMRISFFHYRGLASGADHWGLHGRAIAGE